MEDLDADDRGIPNWPLKKEGIDWIYLAQFGISGGIFSTRK